VRKWKSYQPSAKTKNPRDASLARRSVPRVLAVPLC
jgi:hypothetical protein